MIYNKTGVGGGQEEELSIHGVFSLSLIKLISRNIGQCGAWHHFSMGALWMLLTSPWSDSRALEVVLGLLNAT